MISVSSDGMISMHAGDTFRLPLFIDRGEDFDVMRYKLKKNDIVYFAICEPHQEFNHAVVRKIFTKKNLNKYGDVMIELTSSDTEYVVKGCYYYEIKIKLGNGNIQTIVPKRKFIIE